MIFTIHSNRRGPGSAYALFGVAYRNGSACSVYYVSGILHGLRTVNLFSIEYNRVNWRN